MKIAVTGHRPNKLWGYNNNHPNYIKLGRVLRDTLICYEAKHIITGMALGVDTIFALVGLKLKQSNPDLIVECAIPCRNHSSQWLKESVAIYNDILSRADITTLVTDAPYSSHLMQKRNEYMVDNCDLLIAIWDGTSGGTANCVKYAESRNKEIIRFDPKQIIQ